MKCPKCNFQNENTAKFCRNCGHNLATQQQQPTHKTPTTPKQNSNPTVWALLVIVLIIAVVLGTVFFMQQDNNVNENAYSYVEEPEPVQIIPENTPTYDNGVIINGTKWATRNVGERGKFVSQPHHSGNLYTWDEARNCCPPGWRLPTKDEFEDLPSGRQTTINSVSGREFGTSPNTIFLPALELFGFTDPNNGHYWSSTTYGNVTDAWTFGFYSAISGRNFASSRTDRFGIRCVAE